MAIYLSDLNLLRLDGTLEHLKPLGVSFRFGHFYSRICEVKQLSDKCTGMLPSCTYTYQLLRRAGMHEQGISPCLSFTMAVRWAYVTRGHYLIGAFGLLEIYANHAFNPCIDIHWQKRDR